MKKIYLVITTVGVLFFFSALLLAQSGGTEDLSSYTRIGEYFDEICDDNNKCTLRSYPYKKYFYNESIEEWETINECWFEDSRDHFKTRQYKYLFESDDVGTVISHTDDGNITMTVVDFLGLKPKKPVVDCNTITYEIKRNDISVEYTHLPGSDMIKETFIIYQEVGAIATQDFNLTFRIEGDVNYTLEDYFICDDDGYCVDMQYWIEGDIIKVLSNHTFFSRSDMVYPAYIDPTISLDENDVIYHAYIQFDDNPPTPPGSYTPHYKKYQTTQLFVGTRKSSLLKNDDKFSSVIEWNVSPVPQSGITLDYINLSMWVDNRGGWPNRLIEITHMEMQNDSYPDNQSGDFDLVRFQPDCWGVGTGDDWQGVCNMMNDTYNGTVYNMTIHSATSGQVNHNLTAMANDLMDVRAEGREWWSTGIYSKRGINTTLANMNQFRFASPTTTTASHRPQLIITYTKNNILNCSKELVISEEYDGDGNDIIIMGSDTIILDADLTNHGNIYGSDDGDPVNCKLHCRNGCI